MEDFVDARENLTTDGSEVENPSLSKDPFPFYSDPGYLLFRYPLAVTREQRSDVEPIEVVGAYSANAVLHQDLMPPMPTNGVNEDRAGTGPFTVYM